MAAPAGARARKIAHARIPFRVPPDEVLDERMGGVLAVVYLVFTEGHTASDGDALTRPDLCVEAIRLAVCWASSCPTMRRSTACSRSAAHGRAARRADRSRRPSR